MVAASGKLTLLQQLLPRLLADGHRVLLFSQSVEVGAAAAARACSGINGAVGAAAGLAIINFSIIYPTPRTSRAAKDEQ
jgi:hypothetical protein